MNTTIREIDLLGFAIETGGINADPVALLLLAHSARDLGVDELLVEVMVDEAAPSNARIRAFARISSAVSIALTDRSVVAPAPELLHA